MFALGVSASNTVTDRLTIQYGSDADILYISSRAPWEDQETEELVGDVISRIDPRTDEIENLELLLFSTRLPGSKLFEVPVSASSRRSA